MLISCTACATHWLGVLATTVIALGTLAVGLAVLAYLVQSRKPLPVFTLLRPKSTPVISLILIIALTGAVLDTASALHDIRLPPAVAASAGAIPVRADSSPTLASSLRQWLADPLTTSCAVPAPSAAGAVRVEPLVLVAAAGGGIRAAWWTVQALDRLITRTSWHVTPAPAASAGLAGAGHADAGADWGAALARVPGRARSPPPSMGRCR